MTVYHCLVLTRVGGVPQLRVLDCDAEAGVPKALIRVLGEWREVISAEVFNAGECVVRLDAEQIRSLIASEAS